MEVTKSNFKELLPEIKKSINNSKFLTIDCEFSGLNANNEINSFDTPKQYYEKIRKNCRDFLLIQYGLCTFRYDDVTKSFKQKAFNFYIFPKAVPKYVPDQRFLCQTSSIDFLVAQDFDFNKLFKHGIPYLNSAQETRYRDLLEETQKIRLQNNTNPEAQNRVMATKDADKAFIKNISKQIENFIKSDDEELVLPKCNGFLRLLIYQLVRDNFDQKVNVRNKIDNRDRLLVVTKFTSVDDRLEELNKMIEEEKIELENTIGFSKVIQHIVESRKLIVGHNMVLDLVHTIDKFIKPLPESYEEFKDCVHSLFPMILDTKFLSAAEPFSTLIASNVLGHLLETLSKSPFTLPQIELDLNGVGYSLDDKKEHEAAYDAYITGVSFLAMWSYLGEDSLEMENIYEDFDFLEPYLNKLFLMRLQDSQYIHLGGDDPNPSRDHVFYLTFPKDWKSNDISQLFSPFGAVHIAWVSDSSAYVGLIKRQEAAVALSTLSQSDTYTITTYAKRQDQLAEMASQRQSPAYGRKKYSDSSLSKRRKISGKDYAFDKSAEAVESAKTEKEQNSSNTIVPIAKVSRKRTISKTFEEDNSWD